MPNTQLAPSSPPDRAVRSPCAARVASQKQAGYAYLRARIPITPMEMTVNRSNCFASHSIGMRAIHIQWLIDPVINIRRRMKMNLQTLPSQINHLPVVRQLCEKLLSIVGKILSKNCVVFKNQDTFRTTLQAVFENASVRSMASPGTGSTSPPGRRRT